MVFDSHTHLDDKKFDEDRRRIIDNFKEDQVLGIINVGYDLKSSEESVLLANENKSIYAAVGYHPHDAKKMGGAELEKIKRLALSSEKVVSIGEIGLDYFYDHSPRDVQKDCFKRQLKLAAEIKKPVIMHVRDAYADALSIIKEYKGVLNGVMHCFSGSLEIAKEVLALGFYISFAGPVTFKNASKVKEVAAYAPIDRLLVETDCPYMAPEPYRGKRNEPRYAMLVAREIARLKGMDIEEFLNVTAKNTMELFNIQNCL